jgi:hypothetical protein
VKCTQKQSTIMRLFAYTSLAILAAMRAAAIWLRREQDQWQNNIIQVEEELAATLQSQFLDSPQSFEDFPPVVQRYLKTAVPMQASSTSTDGTLSRVSFQQTGRFRLSRQKWTSLSAKQRLAANLWIFVARPRGVAVATLLG